MRVSKFIGLIICMAVITASGIAQQPRSRIDSFYLYDDVKVTIDQPISPKKKVIIIFYALPNGNTTEQTMGRVINPGDDWRFDIQHISAQTKFLRKTNNSVSFVVIYLENRYKSWPAWKQKHRDYKKMIPHMVDSLSAIIKAAKPDVYLNGHRGGGSFIFGYLDGISEVPAKIKRISFLDSNYGYDSSYYPKLRSWLKNNKGAALNVFAYNDLVALYNGKPFVSATGGTWYRGHLMLDHFRKDFSFANSNTDSLIIYKNTDQRIQFYFKINTDQGIYHTQQVELNGFIHSVLCGTKYDSRNYQYYKARAYSEFVE